MIAEFGKTSSPAPRFMVVDDDRINNLVSRFMILRHCKNAELQLFTDPEIALEVVYEMATSIDDESETVILLDINMPGISGWEFLERFAVLEETARKKFRIYLFSSSIDSNDLERAANHLMLSGFFSKPLTENHLNIALGIVNITSDKNKANA